MISKLLALCRASTGNSVLKRGFILLCLLLLIWQCGDSAQASHTELQEVWLFPEEGPIKAIATGQYFPLKLRDDTLYNELASDSPLAPRMLRYAADDVEERCPDPMGALPITCQKHPGALT